MDYTLSPEIEEIRLAIRAFVAEHVLPIEGDRANFDEHEMIADAPLKDLRAKARAQGLWALQMPKSRGGRDIGLVGMAACYEEMARSPFGPVVFNSSAPDDGTMMALEKILPNEDMKQKWLQPLVDGEVRSAFAMTEPHPGGGSDPSMMLTTAERKGDDWVIRGRKHFITGAEGAAHIIVIAKTSDDPRKGLSAFLYHADEPGWRIERRIPIMGPEEHGGHCEVIYDELVIPDRQRLLEVGDGLKVTQIRLGPARLTHCMRWLGMSKRALEIAGEYIAERESFGMKLDEHEGVQWMMGEAAMDIQVGRLLVMHAAWKLDQGDFAKQEVSMAKVHVADTLHRSVDTAIQLCGARGYSKDTLLEWMYRYARQAKLVDGASEVHKMVLARQHKAQGMDFWSWGV